MQFDRHGNRIWRQAKELLDDEYARRAVGEVQAPYGVCVEPSNVAAGGHACPVRFRCVGCDHFRTDASYLPDLEAYLADLLRNRERLAAFTTADDWAKAIDGRRADSVRRRERVLKALDTMLRSNSDITVSSLARAARVDRTFLYRHRDLLQRVHAAATAPPQEGTITAVSRASLQAELANALERNKRLTVRVRQLEKRLSQALGEAVWAESGLGAPADIDQLQQRITMLEQNLTDVQRQLDERADELEAARAANRELTRALNQRD